MRHLIGVAVVVTSGAGCVSETPFVCTEDAQCVAESGTGTCEGTGFCSFPDEACESGRRYGKAAGDGLASQCVEGGGVGCAGDLVLAAGEAHSCALDLSGSVVCWGNDSQGQLGNDNELRTSSTPAPVDLLPPIAQIDAGANHTCAVSRSGALYCWGDNSDGQLGTGNRFNDFALPVLVAGDVAQVAAGGSTTCFVTTEGQVACMGDNEDNEVADGSATDQVLPVFIDGLEDVAAVDLGQDHGCALRGNGTVACWGANLSGQIGDGTMDPRPGPVTIPGVDDAVEIALGDLHSCARHEGGQVSCWGANFAGQVGDGTDTDRPEPTAVPTITAERVVAGGDHTCAVEAGGALFCWGQNDDGELGDTTQENKSAPAPVQVEVASPGSIALGTDHSCAQDVAGQVSCWGNDISGQLGTGAVMRSDAPIPVIGVSNAIDVAAGRGHSCAVLATGAVRCWGRAIEGELGTGSSGRIDEGPGDTETIAAADAVVASNARTCVHESGDVISCFGGLDNGLLGSGSTSDVYSPAAISATVVSPTAIALGGSHSCALTAAAEVFCWGSNSAGKLGNGSTSSTTVASASTAATMPTVIAAGDSHSCGVDNMGATLCWGAGGSGQLGDGSAADTGAGAALAVAIAAPTALALGSDHSCALLGDATVSCWGANSAGQVGSGSEEAAVLTPEAVSGLDSVAEIAADDDFSCARKTDGTVWCWGENDEGELGAALAEDRAGTPVQVMGLTGATSIAAGSDHACAVAGDGGVLCWGDNTDAQLDGRRVRFPEPQASALVCQ